MAETDKSAKGWIAALIDTSLSAAKIIETERDFVRVLTERVGELVLTLEQAMPDSDEVAQYGDEMRQWLLDVKGLEASVNEVLDTLKDAEILRRIL
jgi:hypothetical protein